MTLSKSIPKQTPAGKQSPAISNDESDVSSRRFQISNEAIGKLATCRAMADIICFENELTDSLDDQTVTTLKFSLWEAIGDVQTLIDCPEFKS